MRKRLLVLVATFIIVGGQALSVSAQPTKPTPTPLPPVAPLFDIPDNYSLWAGTDYAVQSWNLPQTPRLAIQAVFLVVLIIAGLYLLTRFIRDFTRKDAED